MAARMDGVRNLILIASGKGGVGKSTVATNLALALSERGHKTGLLDADIYGPSIPTMLGPAAKPGSPDGKRIYAIEKYGLKLMSMGYMVDPNTAMVWRGPMLAGAVLQFVNDVEWGELDYLVFDLPPGTGDVQLSLAQKLRVTGAVLVTTPQAVALADVVRAKAMFDRVRIPTLGVIENMSYFVCDHCDTRHEIFAHGGGEKIAAELDIHFLGRVPLEPAVRECGDRGTPVVVAQPESQSAQSLRAIAALLDETIQARSAESARQAKAQRGLQIVQ
jgi:ATP-binding protein involved in chromosome partitioning